MLVASMRGRRAPLRDARALLAWRASLDGWRLQHAGFRVAASRPRSASQPRARTQTGRALRLYSADGYGSAEDEFWAALACPMRRALVAARSARRGQTSESPESPTLCVGHSSWSRVQQRSRRAFAPLTVAFLWVRRHPNPFIQNFPSSRREIASKASKQSVF